MRYTRFGAAAALAVLATACAPRMERVRAVQPNGATVRSSADETIARAAAQGRVERERIAAEADASASAALASCSPSVCDAIARGEVAIGMTEDQVLAATRTTRAAWEARGGGSVATLTARDGMEPSDGIAPIAYVTLAGGRVASYAYREPQGLRLVASPADATAGGEARARAEALVREGDRLALAGDFRRALDRYDRADVVDPNNPETTLRIARALDKQLRPYEAAIRYRLFLHQLELERIRAHGETYANMAAAIAEARSRIVILERNR